MASPKGYVLDPNLKRFATERQWEYLVALAEHGSERKAAKALGVAHRVFYQAKKSVAKKAAQSGYAPEYGLTHELPDGLRLKGTSIRYDAAGNVESYWNKSGLAGQEPEEAFHLPDPKKIVKLSTNYDAQGRVTQQWVAEKPEDAQREKLWREFAKELAAELPRVEPTKAPARASSDLVAAFPVGDHHFGMLSWDKETGADYDLEIAEGLLTKATEYLISAAPACDTALIAFLGDLLHHDGFESVTPTSKHHLDSDSRFPKMIRVTVRTIRRMIDMALAKYQRVRVIVEIGNHDLATSIFLMECLSNLYEREPRVEIDNSPMHYHYFRFGKCLIGTHHGHGTKMQNLPLIMATDRPQDWGETQHRAWWTGHIHHSKTQAATSAQDFSGCTVESFRILAPADAWAHQKGYRPIRDMKGIVLHKDHGEVARHTVNPSMF